MRPPPGDKLRRAVQRLAEEQRARPAVSLTTIVDEIALALDLDASESQWLWRQATKIER